MTVVAGLARETTLGGHPGPFFSRHGILPTGLVHLLDDPADRIYVVWCPVLRNGESTSELARPCRPNRQMDQAPPAAAAGMPASAADRVED
jgi:hypothetical protein